MWLVFAHMLLKLSDFYSTSWCLHDAVDVLGLPHCCELSMVRVLE